MNVSLSRILAAALLAAVLTACGSPTPPPEPEPEGFSPNLRADEVPYRPIALSLFAFTTAAPFGEVASAGEGPGGWDLGSRLRELAGEASVVDPDGPNAIEIDTGIWLLTSTLLDLEGDPELVLPDVEDLPAAFVDDWLVPAEDAILNFGFEPGCELSADPAGALVSLHFFFEGITSPGLMISLGTLEYLFLMATTEPLDVDGDLEEQDPTFVGWLYADQDVALTTDGSCDELSVDVELSAGWNQVGWSLTFDAVGDLEGFVLGDLDDDVEVHLQLGF